MTEQVAPQPPPSGAPVPPPPGAPAQPAVPAKAPSAAKGVGKRILGAVVAFAVLSLGGLAWKYLSGDPETAKAGDCLIDAVDADDMKIVECTDATAAYKVVSKVDGLTQAEAGSAESPCTAHPTVEAWLWGGEPGEKGYVLCLEPVQR